MSINHVGTNKMKKLHLRFLNYKKILQNLTKTFSWVCVDYLETKLFSSFKLLGQDSPSSTITVFSTSRFFINCVGESNS